MRGSEGPGSRAEGPLAGACHSRGPRSLMPDWAATSGGTAWEGGGRGTGSQEPSFRFPTARGSSGHSSRPPLDPPIKKEETRRDRLRSGSAA